LLSRAYAVIVARAGSSVGSASMARVYVARRLPIVNAGAASLLRSFTKMLDRRAALQLSEPTAPPRIAPARGPPLWDPPDAGPGRAASTRARTEYEFDQRITW
jgi:hypothetical protein